jgi:hypothetical protein
MGIDVIIVVMLACPEMAWISGCCLLGAGREAEERGNHENKIDGHLFPGTLAAYMSTFSLNSMVLCRIITFY